MKKVVCIIPARGGSKGLHRKNLRKMYGHPLIAWPIEAAKRSKYVDAVVVATDDPEIADIAKAYGAEVPFMRPDDNATDLTTTEETLQFSLLRLEDVKQYKYDYGVFLTCTDVFRREGWIDSAIENMFGDSGLDSSFVASRTHKNYWEKSEKVLPRRLASWMAVYASRQVRQPIYREDTGLCCVSKACLWRNGQRIGNNVKLIDDDRSETAIDIHSEFDLMLAEAALCWIEKNRPKDMPPVPETVL